MIESEKVVVVGFFKNLKSANAIIFETRAKADTKTTYAFVSKESIRSKYDAKGDSIILFKTFDEKQNKFEDVITDDTLEKFVEYNKRPNIYELNEANNDAIFDGYIKRYLVLFLQKEKHSHLLEMV